jgi:hypothetical protein
MCGHVIGGATHNLPRHIKSFVSQLFKPVAEKIVMRRSVPGRV